MLLKDFRHILILMLCSCITYGQSGGDNVMEFLNLGHSARSTALGAGTLSIYDYDIGIASSNPALLNPLMHSDLSFNQNFHFADINHGFLSYGHHIDKFNVTGQFSINYIDYGTFERADEFGNRIGNFDAGATAISIGGGRQLNERVRFGATLRGISSRLESFTSFAMAMDFGMLYHNPEQRLSLAVVIKNAGAQITTYNGIRESLPLDIQLGLSRRFEHLPFRFSIVAHRLHDWSIIYNDNQNSSTSIFGEESSEPSKLSQYADNFFRHFIFNGEFLLGQNENFKLRFGYNHLRRKELSVSTFRSLGGFSLGFGFKIKKFRFDYGVGYYHLAGGVNHISLSTNLNELRNKI